jgi:hypothetical protein
MTRIGITGDRQLGAPSDVGWVFTAINQVLGEHSGDLVGVSSLATDADLMFAALILERRGGLEVVLPFSGHRENFGEAARERYERLVAQAKVYVLPRDGRSDEAAHQQAGTEVISRCELLVAVWNGESAGGPGGPPDIVAHARERGRATVIIDPVRRTITRTGEAARTVPASPGDRALDAARQIGDPLVDPIVAEHVMRHGPGMVGAATGMLFLRSGLPVEHPLIQAYVDALGDIEIGDPKLIARGQRFFALFGPEIFLVLGSCSLPLAFAAGNGVQAIYRARRLKDDPVRRLYDTAQMVINVMQPGELTPGRVGWRSTRKVRLIHALLRWHVQRDPAAPWSPSWGIPINQEDMAGTLLSFSVAVLHGLKAMGAQVSAADADAYVYTWSAVGRLLGVDEALLATTEREALTLAKRIGARQIRATPEGKQLAEQLMKAVATLFPIPSYAKSLTHYFLHDTAFGDDVARVLDLPKPDWTKALVEARAWQKRKILSLLNIAPGARRRRSILARRFVQRMILSRRPEGESPFEVPERFAKQWRVRCDRVTRSNLE